MLNRLRYYGVMVWLIGGGLLWPSLTYGAIDPITVTLDQATIKSGYTVSNIAGTFRLGIQPQAFERWRKLKAVTVTLQQVENTKGYKLKNKPVIGDIYHYSIKSDRKIKLRKPVWLELSFPADQVDTTKVIKYWDDSHQKWKKLSTTENDSALTVRANLQQRNVVVGVFEVPTEAPTETTTIQGIASWYDWTGAACNDFPMGSRIRVTNVHTGAYVDTTIVSTGPFVPGRVVDLTREDFSKIADLSAGLVEVTVQQID